MTEWGYRISARHRLSLLTLFPVLIVLALVVFLPPNGEEGSDWMQFLGRFHPLIVHFPIALFLLVPALELASRNSRFFYLRLTAPFVLHLATLGAALAVLLGWLLARSGGYSGPLVTQHMWAGISLAIVCWVCWMLRARADEQVWGRIYGAVLAVGVGLVIWTGYRGGQLSQGEDHLTEHMPALLRRGLGLPAVRTTATPADPNSFYGARVEPIFTARCVTCHGPDKHKANLRLDSYGLLMRGGKDGLVILPGNPQGSDLFRRVTLPPDHDDFMPKENKQPLSAEQAKLIELWISNGASATLPLSAIKEVPIQAAPPPAPADVTFAQADPEAVAQSRAALAATVAQIQKQFPNILDYESRGSADLHLNPSALGTKFGDSELAALAPVAGHITEADFSRTAITDRSLPVIAAMKRLRVLQLRNTKISDVTLQGLGGLDQLESLSVFGTPVTAASLQAVAGLPKLKHLYAGETAIPSGVTVPPSLTGKLVM